MAIFTVSNTNDSGAGSLRQAIVDANNIVGADFITFGGSVFEDGIPDTISLTSGELNITENLTIDGDIDGNGTPDITVDASENSRVFRVDDGNFYANLFVTLESLVITGGRVEGYGGGILNREHLTVRNSTISSNSTTGYYGYGGGIASYLGDSDYGSLTVVNSTISGNSTTGERSYGGGIFNGFGDLTVSNSTISGNSTAGNYSDGGGIFSIVGDLVTIQNSTISGNTTAGIESVGGGISTRFSTLRMTSSLVTGNTAANAAGDDLSVDDTFVEVEENNLLGDRSKTNAEAFDNFTPSASSITATSNGTDSTPLSSILEPLADNGGGTETHALMEGSPAINAGSNLNSLAFDQRGIGFERVADGQADIGAFEVQVDPVPTNLVVDTLIDENDGSVTDGDVSLRDALAAIADGGTITFTQSLNGGTILLNGEPLTIDRSLTLDGDLDDDGLPDMTVDANQTSRVFNVDNGSGLADRTIFLHGLAITGGQTTAENAGGGGIRNREVLTVRNSIITGNTTTSASSQGGGIYSKSGNLTVQNSTISGNATEASSSNGGGIYSDGNLILSHSTLSDNSTSGNDSSGGGLFHRDGVLLVENSTLSNNSTAGDESAGGGIFSENGNLTVRNSTLSSNSTAGTLSNGGGIFSSFSDLTVSHSTLSENATTGSLSAGGGIASFEGTLTTSNSLIAGNVATQSPGAEIATVRTTVNADANNLFGNNSKTNAVAFNNFIPGASDLTATSDGTRPIALANILEPLADNGGNTQTRALVPGSPAIDAGSNPDSLDFDQRGSGFDRVANGQADIGAFELQLVPTPISFLVVDTLVDENDGSVTDGDVSLREALAAIDVDGTITFAQDLSGGTIFLNGEQLTITHSLTLDGDLDDDGLPDITVNANQNSRVFNVEDGNDLPDQNITLNGLTITSGNVVAADGGGIRTLENLTVTNSVISGNSTAESNGNGGGIFSRGGTLAVTNSTISNNSTTGANSYGGGIFNILGISTVTDSLVSRNSTKGRRSQGGGIFTNTDLTVSNSTIQNNFTEGDFSKGGGIYSKAGNLTVSNSTISSNTTDGIFSDGGGIYSFDSLTVNNSTISGNVTYGDGSEGGGIDGRRVTVNSSTISDNVTHGVNSAGGGIVVGQSLAELTVSNSTIDGNVTYGDNSVGGGIASSGLLTVINSTISGNSTSGNNSRGGGIYSGGYLSASGNQLLINSTISGNSTAGLDSEGGGIFSYKTNLALNNSLVTGNIAANSAGAEIAILNTNINGNAHNLFGDSSKTNAAAFENFAPAASSITATSDGTNPTALSGILAPLADNGGPTQTHALMAGSPALDAGNNLNLPPDLTDQDGDGDTTEAISFDQRGEGFDRVIGGATDIGAFEGQPPPVTAPAFDITVDHGLLGLVNLTFTLRNQSSTTIEDIELQVVYSDDDIIGNSDDQTVGAYTLTDFLVGEQITDGLLVQLPRDLLNSRAQAEDLPGLGSDYVSSSADYIGLMTNIGELLNIDDFTYFPWDIDGSGQVTPSDAIYVINRLGQTTTPENALADFDGSGQITPTDAIAAINRLGYRINEEVIETII